MEEVLQGIGIFMFGILALIGLIAGWIAGIITGRNRALFLVLGVLGAVATPVLIAILGVGALAAGGVIAVILAALAGAVVLVVIGKVLFD